eukprot:jgi/Bigna1/79719/fgenesh1_pg.64_\
MSGGFNSVTEAKKLLVPNTFFNGSIGHPNFGDDSISVNCEIEKGTWSALNQSALMRIELDDGGEITIKLYGPDEDEEPTTAKGRYSEAGLMSGEVFSEGEGGGEFEFSMGKGDVQGSSDDDSNDSAEDDDYTAGEERINNEDRLHDVTIQQVGQHIVVEEQQEEEKTTAAANAADCDDASSCVSKETKDEKVRLMFIVFLSVMDEDIPLLSPVMLFNYLSCKHMRLLLLDARSMESRIKGCIPRSVLLHIAVPAVIGGGGGGSVEEQNDNDNSNNGKKPEHQNLPQNLSVSTVQSWLKSRKEIMAFRSYRLYQTVLIGETNQKNDNAYKIASVVVLHQRVVMNTSAATSRGGRKGSVSILRGGYKAFQLLYPALSYRVNHEGKRVISNEENESEHMQQPLEFLHPLALPSEIVDRFLFIGYGITHVLIISRHKGPYNPFPPTSFEYMRISLPEGNDDDALLRALQFIRAAQLASEYRGQIDGGDNDDNDDDDDDDDSKSNIKSSSTSKQQERSSSSSLRESHIGVEGVGHKERILVCECGYCLHHEHTKKNTSPGLFMVMYSPEDCHYAYSHVQSRRQGICLSRPRWCHLWILMNLFQFHVAATAKAVDLNNMRGGHLKKKENRKIVMVLMRMRIAIKIGNTLRLQNLHTTTSILSASKLTWAVNDYLQEKSDRLNSFVSSLNTRYVELKKENRTLQNELSALRRQNRILRAREAGGRDGGGKAVDNTKLKQELTTLKATLKQYSQNNASVQPTFRLLELAEGDGVVEVHE